MKKHIFYCLAILSLIAASCGTSRHAVTATANTRDTLVITVHDTFNLERKYIERVYVHDTTIVTPKAQTTQTVNPATMVPGMPYTTTSGNVRSTIKKDSAGNISAECEADSLKIVIRALMEKTVLQDEQKKHLTTASTDKKSYTEATYKETYQKGKGWFSRNWQWLSALIILCFVAELIYRKVY